MTRDEIVEQLLGQITLGLALPTAIGRAWDAGRTEERLDTLRMERAIREAKRPTKALRAAPAPGQES
jgi:hypothetical protein